MTSSGLSTKQLKEIARALPTLVNELSGLFLHRAAPTVSRTDVNVMLRLAQRPHRITELTAEEQISQPGMTLLVNRMQERGWAERRPDPADGRAVLVSLTDQGREALATLQEAYDEMLASHMDALSEEEVHTLSQAVAVLESLIAHLKQP